MAETRRIALAAPIWHDPPRFAVGGQTGQSGGDVKVYEWIKDEMRMIGFQTDVGLVKAMAWAPHPAHSSILALGLSTGRSALYDLSPSTLSPSPNVPSVPLAILQIKHLRPVTSLSFSPVDPSYLAVGLERHRSDHSLLIYDVSDAMALSPPDLETAQHWARPDLRLESTNSQSYTTKEPRHVQAYCPSELVNSVAFMSTGYEVLASTNNRTIRLFDLRAQTGSSKADTATGASHSWTTRAVYGLSPDPLAPERFASFEPAQGQQPSVVRLWDVRRAGEVLSWELHDGAVELEWDGRGGLGVAMKNGGVQVWDVASGQVAGAAEVTGMRQVVKPRNNLHSFTFAPIDETSEDVLFIGKDGVMHVGPISSAPVVASGPQGDTTHLTPSSRIHTLYPAPPPDRTYTPPKHDVEVRVNRFQLSPRSAKALLPAVGHAQDTAVPDEEEEERKVAGIPRWIDELADDVGVVMRRRAVNRYGLASFLHNVSIAERYAGGDQLHGVWEFLSHFTKVMAPSNSRHPSFSQDLTHLGVWQIWTGSLQSPQRSSSGNPNSPSASMRRLSNQTATTADTQPVRQGSAAWAALKKTQSGEMATAYMGTGGYKPRTLSTASNKRSGQMMGAASVAPAPSAEWIAVAASVNQFRLELNMPGAPGRHALPNGDRSPLRRLILGIVGENHDLGAMFEINRLIQNEQRTKAAAWAYFASEEESAARLLLESPDTRHRLIGATLATAMLRTNRRASAQEWSGVVSGVDDPFIRAVLRRISGEGWDSVLSSAGEDGMGVADRLSIAVCNLGDRELSEYLLSLASSRTERPLSLLPLFGLTPLLLPSLDAYVSRTGDVQSVSLISALIDPSTYSTREASMVKRWHEAYRDLLDRWKFYHLRVDFDVMRQEMAARFDGDDGVQRQSRGVKARECPICQSPLSRMEMDHLSRKNALKATTAWPNERTPNCTYCGNALPNCIICLQHVEPRFRAGRGDEADWNAASPDPIDTLDAAYVCCLTCRHGGHANHVLAWFYGESGSPGHDVCAVSGCECRCNSI